MKCPDKAVITRLLDGEHVPGEGEIRAHIGTCPRCRSDAETEGVLDKLLKTFFSAPAPAMCDGRGDYAAGSRPASGNLSSPATGSSLCPPPAEIASYVEGRVAQPRKGQLLKHFCVCPRCAQSVLDASRTVEAKPAPAPEALVREARAVYRKE